MRKSDSVHVRAANGAIYKDPVLFGRGGFVSFPPMPDELRRLSSIDGLVQVWARDGVLEDPRAVAEVVLNETLGNAGWTALVVLDDGKPRDVEVPGDQTRRPASVIGASFQLLRPIPEPKRHKGYQRYKSRLRGETVLDPEPVG